MGKTYFSRVFYGCLIERMEIPKEDDKYKAFLESLDDMGNEFVGISMVCDDDKETIFFLFEKETIFKIDERDARVRPISNDHSNIKAILWKKDLNKLARMLDIDIQEPSWFITCESW